MGRAGSRGRVARPARASHALDGAGPRATDERGYGSSAYAPRDCACVSSRSRRRSSVEAAGTRTSRSQRHAPSSVTRIARLARGGPPTSLEGERWATLAAPGFVELPSGQELRAIPTTHSLGDLARALMRRSLPALVHVYFHDTDLLDARRRALLRATLPVLARRASVTDLDVLATRLGPDSPRVAWDDVARL